MSSTYEQGEAATRHLIAVTLPAIAQHLGDGWTQGHADADGDRDWRARQLSHPDGRTLHFSVDRAKREIRLEIRGGWPQLAGGDQLTPRSSLPYDVRHDPTRNLDATITVSAGKSPQAIAADISRRLLPEYTDLYQRLMTYATERNAHRDHTYALACRLAAAFEIQPPKYEERADQYMLFTRGEWPFYQLQVNSPTSITVRDLSGDEALILQLRDALRPTAERGA